MAKKTPQSKSKKTKGKKEDNKKASKILKPTSTVAKSEDGTIQITFTIAFELIDKERKETLREIGKNLEVPGFRKGKAPIEKVAERTNRETLIQKTLSKILPSLVGETIRREKLRPAIYPRFEVIKAVDNEPWQVRATTCELPNVVLGDYKAKIKGLSKTSKIWTPDKGSPTKKNENNNEMTPPQKEQAVIKILLETSKITIPKLLINEEVNNRLSKLLERIEKLGLQLDSYLSSVGKNPQILRKEYEKQAEQSIALELILNEISRAEKVSIEPKLIDSAIKASSADPKLAEKLNTPEQRKVIEAILTRKKALDSLIQQA